MPPLHPGEILLEEFLEPGLQMDYDLASLIFPLLPASEYVSRTHS